ncbi:MAG TPA: signal peptidase II [Nannocystis sp.]
MTEPSAASSARRRAILLTAGAALVWLVLDLWSKSWAWHNLRPPNHSVAVLGDWLAWSYSFNPGAAFGLGRKGDFARPLFIVVTLVTVVYMGALVRKLPTERRYGFFAIGSVIGGALGNLHDRIVRQDHVPGVGLTHGVVDFIRVCAPWDPQIPGVSRGTCWPNFNVADIALVVGVILLIPYLLFHAQTRETTDNSNSSTPAA